MRVRRVETVEEALNTLAEFGDAAQPVAGGTDVMIQLSRNEISPDLLMPIHELAELSTIETNGVQRVGSLVTHEALAKGALGPSCESIAEAALTVGGWQTQTVGTLGGNICNASPAADTLPPLLVHDAEVQLRSSSGSRSLPLQDFFLGRRETVRQPDELLMSVSLAPAARRAGDVYLKVGRRGAMEVAVVGYAMRLVFDEEGKVSQARIALASVAPVPVRARAAESLLEGRHLDESTLTGVSEAILDAIDPIDDLRASASYRKLLIPGLTRRAAAICARRSGVSEELTGGRA